MNKLNNFESKHTSMILNQSGNNNNDDNKPKSE